MKRNTKTLTDNASRYATRIHCCCILYQRRNVPTYIHILAHKLTVAGYRCSKRPCNCNIEYISAACMCMRASEYKYLSIHVYTCSECEPVYAPTGADAYQGGRTSWALACCCPANPCWKLPQCIGLGVQRYIQSDFGLILLFLATRVPYIVQLLLMSASFSFKKIKLIIWDRKGTCHG